MPNLGEIEADLPGWSLRFTWNGLCDEAFLSKIITLISGVICHVLRRFIFHLLFLMQNITKLTFLMKNLFNIHSQSDVQWNMNVLDSGGNNSQHKFFLQPIKSRTNVSWNQ